MPERKAGGFGKFLLWIAAIVCVLVTAGQIGFYLENRPVGSGSQEVEFKIEEGESWQQVLDNLQKDKLIHSSQFASLLLKLDRGAEHYAGTYLLNDGMSTQEIIAYLGNSANQEAKDVTVTIVPGTWAKDVAENLATLFPYSAQDFIDKWNDQSYIETLAQKYAFLNAETLSNSELKVKLEGYLYPETYSIKPDATIDDITRTFLDGFDAMYQENKAAFDNSGMTVEEAVTLASIIQFEAGSESDMATISGVFHNRLNAGMSLESSVTVCYALYEDFSDATACETSYDIDSPYNTYIYAGLPVGPINNPGKAAILAALQPEENDYYFFVADVNNVKDGGIYYSATYEDHLAIAQELGLLY